MNEIFHRTSIRKYGKQQVEAFAIIPCGYPEKVGAQQDRYEEARVHFVE